VIDLNLDSRQCSVCQVSAARAPGACCLIGCGAEGAAAAAAAAAAALWQLQIRQLSAAGWENLCGAF